MDDNLAIYSNVTALTGSSGSGKSTVARILRDLGAHIVSADELSRIVVNKGSEALGELLAEFGPQAILENGNLDRSFLRYTIFSDKVKKKKAEAIIHPRVKDLAIQAFKTAINLKCKPIIYDAPLFFEAGLDSLNFKGSILVYATDEDCVKRIMIRDNLTKQDAEIRLEHQIPSEQKMKGANFIINNSGSIQDLELAVNGMWEHLIT